MQEMKLQRRQVFQGLIALSAVGGVAACRETTDPAPVNDPPLPGFFDRTEMAFVAAVAQTIIPRTETAGAIEAGVPETLQALATDWGDEAFQLYWRSGLQAIAAALKAQIGSAFETAPTEQRQTQLTAFDASVFAGDIDDTFYRDFKSTVVQAYYMSEPGATEELAYEPVPGEWIGCVELSDYPKTWAT